jgi:hypothetical protein
MIKFKDEIKSRPKSEWIHNKEQKQEIKKQSKKELESIKSQFGSANPQISKNSMKR